MGRPEGLGTAVAPQRTCAKSRSPSTMVEQCAAAQQIPAHQMLMPGPVADMMAGGGLESRGCPLSALGAGLPCKKSGMMKTPVYIQSSRFAWLSGSLVLAMVSARAATFEVGPGLEHATPSDVPWESLEAGDVVRIHYRGAAYQDKWVICRRGTAAQPIIVQGVPGPGGELPVIDGNGATTRRALNYWNGPRGVIKIGGANVPPDTTPAHVIVEHLEIRSARPPYGFTDHSGSVQDYPNNAAAIYIEKGDAITIRGCVMRDCGNGLFVAASARDVVVESNHVYDNGNVGSIYEHNSYTAAAGITFQFNRYGPLREGCLGNNLKDRSAGTVIRYNWIESGNRQLDLVDAEDSAALRQDPRYRSTFVYGNILIEPDGAGNSQVVHYGGDSGNTPTYRKGTLYFHHNTVISTRTGNTTLFRLSTNDESADCRNNIVFVTAAGNRLALLAEAGKLAVTHNWAKAGRVSSHAGNGFSGSVTDDATWVAGSDPGFVDFARQNLRLKVDSACLNAAGPSHAATAEGHAVVRQYLKHQRHEPRRLIEVPDLGAYEFSPFEAWRGQHFGEEAANEGISGASADPDGDGIPNLVEYAFDLDPNESSQAGLPRAVRLAQGNAEYLGVEFRRRPAPSELVYATAVSGNLSDWQSGCEYSDLDAVLATEVVVDASDAEWTWVRLEEPLGAGVRRMIVVTVGRE